MHAPTPDLGAHTVSPRERTAIFSALVLVLLLASLDQTIVVDRAADHRQRDRRPDAPVVDRHRLPAGDHGRRAAVRQARRHLRPPHRAAGGRRHFPHRLRPVRHGAEPARADRLPHHPGPRRRRPHRHRHRRRGRHRSAARARPLPGLLRRRVRHLDGARPAARRLHRRSVHLALDLLHQPAARPAGAGRHQRDVQAASAADRGEDRLRGRRAARHCPDLRHPHLQPRLDAAGRGAGQPDGHLAGRGAVARRLHLRRDGGARSAAAAVAVPQPRLRAGGRHRLHRRHGAVRLDHAAARLSPGREGPRSDQRRPAPDADDARRVRHLDHERADHHPHRPLQDIPRRRHGADDDRRWRCCRASPSTRRRRSPPATCCCSAPGSAW